MARLRRLKVDDLPRIDERVEASLERIDRYSPDELVWAVERAADEIAGWLGGDRRRPARPLLIAHVDLANVTATAAATVELAASGASPTLTAATVEALSRDADLRMVLFDGARPLAASAKTRAADIPADTRLAVAARDGGCRFPGSTAPVRWSELHHIVPRAQGGDHHPENLALLTRRWHRLVHRRAWKLHLDPETGELTTTRNGRTWHSLPHGSPLRRPPPQPATLLTAHSGQDVARRSTISDSFASLSSPKTRWTAPLSSTKTQVGWAVTPKRAQTSPLTSAR